MIFRADGNSQTGLGHLYRAFALVEIYKEYYDCIFVTRSDTSDHVIPESYDLVTIPETISLTEEPLWLVQNFGTDNNWLLTDGYQFNSQYQKTIKQLNFRLICVDDLCNEKMYADIVINHAPGVKASDYSATENTRFALGTKYAILRPLFLKAAATMREVKAIENVFICFGGADMFDLTLKAAKACLHNHIIKKVNVVTGAAYRHTELALLAKSEPRLVIYKNLNEQKIIEVMNGCDLAIAPASNILYEICAVKMPVISGYYVDNQKNIYEGAVKKKIVFDAGNLEHYSVDDFEGQVARLMKENNTQKYIAAQAELFDGQIKNRFLDLLAEFSYRKATDKDMLQVFDWSNDSLSRINSYFSEPIELKTHEAWFDKKINSPTSYLYIAEINGIPAGLVRYEVSAESTVVGILVGNEFRNRGLAAKFLKDTASLYFAQQSASVLAYIKIENKPSVQSFEKAGYQYMREETMHGHPSFVYQLDNSDDQK